MKPEETRLFGRTLAAIAHRIDALSDEALEHLRQVPVRRAVDAFDAVQGIRDYNFVSAEVEAIDADARLAGGDEWARTYWDLVLLHLVARSLQAPSELALPPLIVEYRLAAFERIVASATGAGPDDPIADDDFLIDLALARGAALDFGKLMGVVIEAEEGRGDLTAGTWMFAHLNTEEYGLDALIEIMPTVLEFFDANPDLRGCAGAGWLVDPEVAKVSPHLAWYREVLEQMGAHFVISENGPGTVELAIGTSNTRRERFEAGAYRPQNYMWILPREALLQVAM